jgi:hypothetical protein
MGRGHLSWSTRSSINNNSSRNDETNRTVGADPPFERGPESCRNRSVILCRIDRGTLTGPAVVVDCSRLAWWCRRGSTSRTTELPTVCHREGLVYMRYDRARQKTRDVHRSRPRAPHVQQQQTTTNSKVSDDFPMFCSGRSTPWPYSSSTTTLLQIHVYKGFYAVLSVITLPPH